MLHYTTRLISCMDPIKYIFEKPALTREISRWQMLFSEFNIAFVTRKAIKGQAIADYLAAEWSRTFRIPLPWWGHNGTRAKTKQCGTVALEALLWWGCQFYQKWNGSSLSFPEGPTNPYFGQAEFWLHQQRHRIQSMYSQPASGPRVRRLWLKRL